jgi:L-amino acid N-acyltransferase YncA
MLMKVTSESPNVTIGKLLGRSRLFVDGAGIRTITTSTGRYEQSVRSSTPFRQATMESTSTMNIRRAGRDDFPGMWDIFQAVVAPGDSYVFAPDTSQRDAFSYWFGPGVASYVAMEADQILGMYKLIPNQRDLGAHVANASFMVHPANSGRGIGKSMGIHCLREARRAGFLYMQFNFVVSTNRAAVGLWEKLGFTTIGTIPNAFRHQQLGFVDALVMYRSLQDVEP